MTSVSRSNLRIINLKENENGVAKFDWIRKRLTGVAREIIDNMGSERLYGGGCCDPHLHMRMVAGLP